MLSELMAEHLAMANAAQDWLRQRGSCVTNVRVFMRRPLLEIACPPVALLGQAHCINETFKGGNRSVWIASVEGCQVMWR